jgi:hypothetical protein
LSLQFSWLVSSSAERPVPTVKPGIKARLKHLRGKEGLRNGTFRLLKERKSMSSVYLRVYDARLYSHRSFGLAFGTLGFLLGFLREINYG